MFNLPSKWALNTFSILCMLTLTSASPYPDPATYWIDDSCRLRFSGEFQQAFDDALTWARRGGERLVNLTDTLQEQYFNRLFSPAGSQGHPQYEERVWNVTSQ